MKNYPILEMLIQVILRLIYGHDEGFNLFLVKFPILYPLKIENPWFSGVFRGYKMESRDNVNKNMLKDNMKEKSLSSQPFIYDHI